VLGALISDQEFEVGAQFRQQERAASGSVPDGEIRQQSFQVIVETKTHQGFSKQQLQAHLKKFQPHVQKKVLLLLSPELVDAPVRASGVTVQPTTFAQLVEACNEAVAHDHALQEIVADYEDYCLDSNLISNPGDRLLIVPVRISLADNHKHRLYYCPADRTIQRHLILGLYAAKTVGAIGKIENVVVAHRVGTRLKILEKLEPVSKDQQSRIMGAMEDAQQHAYEIDDNHRFFLVEEFIATDFKKTTSGGLFNRRYFSLREELGLDPGAKLPNVSQIATALRECTWE